MATSLKLKAPSLESFEETYKTAYSHGLEAIYALEAVDLKTVKKFVPFSRQSHILPPKTSVEPEVLAPETASQLEFDLGEGFRDWIEPLFLEEPLAVLQLSFQAQAALSAAGLHRVGDIVCVDFERVLLGKGVAQGYLEEIRKKKHAYIGGRSIEKVDLIDWRSLILSMTMGISQKKLPSLLQETAFTELSPDLSRQREVEETLRKIAQAFLLPWIESKGSVVNKDEIMERLENLSVEPGLLLPSLQFLSEHFAAKKFPFESFLFQAESGLFFNSKESLIKYQQVIDRALSYFPSKKEFYSFNSLKTFLLREFAKEWTFCDETFLTEILHRSSLFAVFRDSDGVLGISCS